MEIGQWILLIGVWLVWWCQKVNGSYWVWVAGIFFTVILNLMGQKHFKLNYKSVQIMEKQKNEFIRKPRKLFSRDRSGQLGTSNRQRSKEVNDKNSVEPMVMPQKIILGLRNQLTNLKEEVAKLSRREKRSPLPQSEICLQYEGGVQRQKKCSNVHYFKESEPVLSQQMSNQSTIQHMEDETLLKIGGSGKKNEMVLLQGQLKELQLQNRQLSVTNQQLRMSMKLGEQKIKLQYQQKIRSLQLVNEGRIKALEKECSRMDLVENQNREQKGMIEQLRESLKTVTNFNVEQTKEISALRVEKKRIKGLEQELAKKGQEALVLQKRISQMSAVVQQSEKRMSQCQQQLVAARQYGNRLKQQRDRQMLSLKESRENMNKMMNRVAVTEKVMVPAGDARVLQKLRGEIKQLQHIVSVQQASIANYHGDLNYLEQKLEKVAFVRPMYERVLRVLEETNEECVRMQLERVNAKYYRF